MPELKSNPQLKDYQKYVEELEIDRGFASQTALDKCLLLGEEMGELFKAIRKSEGLSIDSNSTLPEVGDELADVFIYICALANRKNIDLEAAFRIKEEKNKKRRWKPIINE